MSEACKIEWIEIPAENLDKAKKFYREIFNWEVTDYKADYCLFKSGTINGGFNRNRKPNEDGIIFSITVDDISVTLKNIVAAGGSVVKEKYGIGDGFGFSASFNDPNENMLELWAEK